jgi:superfamily II DNA or RNA helicase
MQFDDLKPESLIQGLIPNRVVRVIHLKSLGPDCVQLTYEDTDGKLGNQLVYRWQESQLSLVSQGRAWAFDADGALFRLSAEALRIRLAHYFDPLLAVNSSDIQPLPHQITAVYEKMLPRLPLRFLLADDPGAGKTIMSGLLIKELMIRGDVRRCLIVSPGNLVEQWQDELDRKFDLPFDILTNDKMESSRTGNWLSENDLVIARLDKLARDEDLKAKLEMTDWDLIICDEAHKMSASFFGNEVKYTQRHKLGQLLSRITRHFLLLTATPHNGKEEDFQLFMSLLDGDRFEGKFRDGVHKVDVSDMMRRLVKEKLVKFDGTPLFPERRAYTVHYELSELENALYAAVTTYVREEWSKADRIQNERGKASVGFALTMLQRRLASSPAAIAASLRRRRERLEDRLREEEILAKGARLSDKFFTQSYAWDAEELEDLDEDPAPEDEDREDLVVDAATAAQTITQLKAEILQLKHLEELAQTILRSGHDRKWDEVSKLIQKKWSEFDTSDNPRKLVIFTEHRDTLEYLKRKIQVLSGERDIVAVIYGGMSREERRKSEELFKNHKSKEILVATDAAGEGINLQRAHLMINYDLPWNPNRLEQRFGRIHRIGQTEVCHLWNLVAAETREGEVYERLLRKIESIQNDLGQEIFNVLGDHIFKDFSLRDLLVEAIRYGDDPANKARLDQIIDDSLDVEHLKSLLEERALASDSLSHSKVQEIRDIMEKAQMRRLAPHFIRSFFEAAFAHLGGTMVKREKERYEITRVPPAVRDRDRVLGRREVVTAQYHRVVFDKGLKEVPGKPQAELVAPGHPLLSSVIDLILEKYRSLLKQGAILVDDQDPGTEPHLLVFLHHAVKDGTGQSVSERMQFVRIGKDGSIEQGGPAPYLDLRPLKEEELPIAQGLLAEPWLAGDFEPRILGFAAARLVPEHFEEVRTQREESIDRTLARVRERLTREIAYWDHRAEELRLDERSGRINTKINSAKAEGRRDELLARLEKRERELTLQRQFAPLPPRIESAALVIPRGLLGYPEEGDDGDRARIEALAMEAVMQEERRLGNQPNDVSAAKRGWDIESRDKESGELRFIEVKGRIAGATSVTVTKNEIYQALHNPERFILALVFVQGDAAERPRYIRNPFDIQPDWAAASVNYEIGKLLSRQEVMP